MGNDHEANRVSDVNFLFFNRIKYKSFSVFYYNKKTQKIEKIFKQ